MKKEKSNRKRICFLGHELIVGGLENVLIEALKVLHTKYDVEVVSIFQGIEKSVLESFPSNVKVRVGPFFKNKIIEKVCRHFVSTKYLSKFYFDRVIKHKYDYVISLKSLERFACFSSKCKYHIFWCHNDFHTKFMRDDLDKLLKKDKALTKTLFKHHNMVWTVNETIAEELQDLYDLDKFYALPNPINCNEILAKANQPCDVIFDKNKTNIVLLGRISSEKGFTRVMKKDIFDQFPNTHIYVIGDSEQRTKFEKYVERRELCEKVTFLGAKSNPYPYLKQADLLLVPSKYESFGLVIVEAMLLEVPIIATATTGAKYITQKGKYACCVENNDEALQKAICEFLENPKSYTFSKQEAKNRALEFDVSRFQNRLLELLEKCENL